MSSVRLLFAAISISLCCSFVTGERADARGGGGYVPPVKETREPGLWYGDSYVPEDIKQATYKNYTAPTYTGNGYGPMPTWQAQPQTRAQTQTQIQTQNQTQGQGQGQNPQYAKYSLPQNFSGPVISS